MALPITLDEIRPQLKAMFLPLNNDVEVKYTLVHINNQFKIVGTFYIKWTYIYLYIRSPTKHTKTIHL